MSGRVEGARAESGGGGWGLYSKVQCIIIWGPAAKRSKEVCSHLLTCTQVIRFFCDLFIIM